MPAAVVAFTLTGNAATLTYAPVGNYTLTADSASFAMTGNAVNLLRTYVVPVDVASFILTGNSTSFQIGGTAVAHDGGDGFTPQEAARRKKYYKELDERREKDWEKRKGKKRRKPKAKAAEPTIEPAEQVTPITVEEERAATEAMLDLRNVELQQARMRREKDDMEAMMILMAA